MGHYGPAVWDTQRGHGVPIVALWQGFLAVQAIDIVFSVLAIFGLEGQGTMVGGAPVFHIPYSHSLVTSLLIAAICGLGFKLLKPSAGWRGFWIIAALVFSHWVLDFIVHRPDLLLYPGSDVALGLSFWDYPLLAFALEMGLLLAGFWFWKRVTIARSMRYTVALWVLFGFMGALQFAVIVWPGLQVQAGTFDPSTQPEGVGLGLSALFAFGLLTAIVAWIERGRPSRFAPRKA
ncbi:hypothetical protein ACJ3XI_06825 [Litorimonas sp. RW-G-Af-16]|uniref:hypothetical protein n=1 Tax=Litorimonas sp. RW-G-Af-16 TaxID=3241168 RepID=UPI00390C759A